MHPRMSRPIALLTVVSLLPACGGGPPIVTDPSAPRVRWNVELHTPKPSNPEKYNKQDVILVLDRDDQMLVAGTAEMPLASIENATYSFAKKPRWVIGLILFWPLLFLKKKQHWLALSCDDGRIWVLKMKKQNYSNILTVLEKEGLEVTYFTEQ